MGTWRALVIGLSGIAVVVAGAGPAEARAGWKREIDRLVAPYDAGVAVAEEGRLRYSHRSRVRYAPASNQKVLTSMALLDRLGPGFRLTTRAHAERRTAGTIRGDLWISGRGDPTLSSGGTSPLPGVAPTRVRALAARIRAAGVTRITGDVLGDKGGFRRDWDARGWLSYMPARFAPLPTALSLDGNVAGGVHISDPERRAARALAEALRFEGVIVLGRTGAGHMPESLGRVAAVASEPLWRILGAMNEISSNFTAEVLGKRLGADAPGLAGTIAGGAHAVERWALRQGVELTSHDGSGLSYSSRVSARGMTRLLGVAEQRRWGALLRRGLPEPGRGTLAGRLAGVPVRAKTGTHFNGDSALSGWVRLQDGSRAAFSILSVGMPKTVEDAVVRAVARARPLPEPPPPPPPPTPAVSTRLAIAV